MEENLDFRKTTWQYFAPYIRDNELHINDAGVCVNTDNIQLDAIEIFIKSNLHFS